MTCFEFDWPLRLSKKLWLQFLLPITIASFPLAQAQTVLRTEMLVSAEWLASHLTDRNLVVLCVVDDESFYSSGHIPGSTMVRLSDIVTTQRGIPNELPSISHLEAVFENAGVSNGSRIIIYGQRSGMLAARAYFTLDYLGVADRAALLDGGIEKWRAERRQESTAALPVRVGKLDVRVHPEVLVNLEQMAAYSQSTHGPAIVDSRPHGEYIGNELSEDVPKRGHIPRASGLYWRNLLSNDAIPTLKSPSELQELFRASGAASHKEVITYCRTGMQSSFSYFTAKYLGYKVRMYDGSFYEWSRSSLPVEP